MSFTSDFVIIGHRGAAGLAPENTIAGFELAQDLGVDAVEFDVRMVDTHLAVFHDSTLDRTTNGFGSLHDLTWPQLRRLDAGRGQRVPELSEVLECLHASTGINIELKGLCTGAPCAEFLRSGSLDQEVIVSSFHTQELHEFREEFGGRLDDVQVGLLVSEIRPTALQEASAIEAWSIHVHDSIATPSHVTEIMNAGFQVFVYTVNDPERARQIHAMGARGIFTDLPDRMLQSRG